MKKKNKAILSRNTSWILFFCIENPNECRKIKTSFKIFYFMWWMFYPGPLEEQPALLPTEPFIQFPELLWYTI